MPFTTPIVLQAPTDESGTLNWKTVEPLNYDSVRYGKHFVVPKDFETDLASVPHDFLAWFVAGGRGNAAAIIHDFQYSQPKLRQAKSREEADYVFYEAMIDTGVSAWRAWLMYRAVRALGWQFYVE